MDILITQKLGQPETKMKNPKVDGFKFVGRSVEVNAGKKRRVITYKYKAL